MRGFNKSAQQTYDAIVEMWKSQGWAWDTHSSEAAKKMLKILPSILSDELEEIKKTITVVSESLDVVGFETVRARDAFLLYNRLIKSGACEETASYAMYAFLRGNGNDEEELYKPTAKNQEEGEA